MSIGFFTSHFWSTKMQELERVTYIAAPFFTEEQKIQVEYVEHLLDVQEEPFFSPREFGVITEGGMNDQQFKRIFDMNIRMMNNAFRMVAITDDFDPGVMFEIGYAYSIGVKVITYSPKGYGSNVMIAKAAWTHCKHADELELALGGHKIEEDEVTS